MKISEKTNEDIYLEWLNDYITVGKMAEHYNISPKKLSDLIDKGRNDHLQKFESPEYKRVWNIKP